MMMEISCRYFVVCDWQLLRRNKMINIKSALVLGANGFIGSHLVSKLKRQGSYVVGIDIGEAPPNSLNLLPPQTFIKIHLPDPGFARILHEYQPDIVINAAGSASVPASLADPSRDFYNSVHVCFFVLEELRKNLPGCRFLQLSSAAVYGNPTELPIRESTALMPISPYGYNKLICEIKAEEYAKIFDLKTSTLRIFSAFGPGLRKQLLWDLYQKSQAEKTISLFGTGAETRDFIFIDDIIRVIELVAEKGQFSGDVYNVANGCEVSIRTLTKLFLEQLGLGGMDIRFSGITKPGDPLRWCADIGRIEQLGYAPQFNLEQGLAEYAGWVKGIYTSHHE